jgi:hypothetical protein
MSFELLNAVNYSYNDINYDSEFQRILQGVYECYTRMLNDKVKVHNDENEIRNELVDNYLNNDEIKMSTKLYLYSFNSEVLENKKKKVDIKVEFRNNLVPTKAYYIIECKRLNNKNIKGLSGLNAEYIENGIYRFVSKQYSTYNKVNAMIGFIVEKMDIDKNVKNINALLQHNQFRKCNTIREIKKESFVPNFEFHYSSEHKDCDKDNLILYHLMFDFSDNIN